MVILFYWGWVGIRNPPRKVSLSYKSLLTAPPQVKRRMSTPCSPISYTRSSVDKATDDGTSNTTTTEQDDGNLNDTGSKIPANDDTSKQDLTKLPKIVLPRTPRQNGKSRKNKKQRKKFENKELEVESDDTPSELDEKMADSEESGKSSVDTSTPSLDSEADMDSWKYRLEAKHFQLGTYVVSCRKFAKEKKKKKEEY
ncbi:hypothetical protein QZH41_009593 [Actinostola sp. cb2023]|nr:hypothetical protein QZH41_009593 [Actinostola sp. cb2023]